MQLLGGSPNSNLAVGLFSLTPLGVGYGGKFMMGKSGRSAMERNIDAQLAMATTITGGSFDLMVNSFGIGAYRVPCKK